MKRRDVLRAATVAPLLAVRARAEEPAPAGKWPGEAKLTKSKREIVEAQGAPRQLRRAGPPAAPSEAKVNVGDALELPLVRLGQALRSRQVTSRATRRARLRAAYEQTFSKLDAIIMPAPGLLAATAPGIDADLETALESATPWAAQKPPRQ